MEIDERVFLEDGSALGGKTSSTGCIGPSHLGHASGRQHPSSRGHHRLVASVLKPHALHGDTPGGRDAWPQLRGRREHAGVAHLMLPGRSDEPEDSTKELETTEYDRALPCARGRVSSRSGCSRRDAQVPTRGQRAPGRASSARAGRALAARPRAPSHSPPGSCAQTRTGAHALRLRRRPGPGPLGRRRPRPRRRRSAADRRRHRSTRSAARP